MPPASALAKREPAPLAQQNQLSLGHIAESWRRHARGGEFVDALRTFLASLRSEHTRKAYTGALRQFIDWYESVHQQLPLPSAITRERAFEYATWMRARTTDLREYRLKQDPGRKVDRLIYAFLRQSPGADINAIRNMLAQHSDLVRTVDGVRRLELEADDPFGLDRHLGCLAETNTIRRTPTIDDVRSRRVAIDPALDPTQAQIGYRLDPNLFRYRVPEAATLSPSSITTHLAALRSFWEFMMNSGENEGRGEPLLRYNIWSAPCKQARREQTSHQRVNREQKTPGIELFNRLIGTTYVQPETGTDLVASMEFDDVRDRALLLFALHVAARVSELASLQRRHVTWGAQPVVDILGKGSRRRLVAIPPVAFEALQTLTRKLEMLTTHAERKGGVPGRARALLEPDAPLFPAVKRWGCIAGESSGGPLTADAIRHMLHRRAELAGMPPDSVDLGKAHPHGLRHLGAKIALEHGTPINIVQAVLGHESLSTTGRYVESHDATKHVLFTGSMFDGPPAATPVAAPSPVGPAVRPVAAPPPRVPTAPPLQRAARAAPPTKIVETTGIPVPPPAAVSSEERLIAVGDLPPLEFRSERGRAPVHHESGETLSLDAIHVLQVGYERSWGDKGNRQRLRVPGSLGRDQEALGQTYAGRATALVWWDGPTGQLEPSMPVLGPSQVEGSETPFGSAMKGLDEMWGRWLRSDEENRGPTAAYALIAWIRDALTVAVQVNEEVEHRRGDWLPHDAPLELGYLPTRDAERKRFRLHRDDRVVEWFTQRAWEHRISRGRTGLAGERRSQVVDKRPDLPAWYGLADPLVELPDADRADLFDWLYALTGRPPQDLSPRFDRGLSRRKIAEIIGLWCEYDDGVDELKEASRAGKGGREVFAQLKDDVNSLELAIRQQLTKAQVSPDFSYPDRVRARIEQTRKLVTKEGGPAPESVIDDRVVAKEQTRESRRDFYMRLVGELFGAAAADDPYLRIFALCSRGAPLAGSNYAQLFKIDPRAKTIVHDPDYARRFAQETHMHSECVARRLARELWELRQKHIESLAAGGRGERLLDRPDELIEALDAMAAYRVPCPQAMETALRARIGAPSPAPVYEEWRRWRDERKHESASDRVARERAETVAETMAEAQEQHRGAVQREFAAKPNPRAKEYRYTPNVAKLVPSPVVLLFCLYS